MTITLNENFLTYPDGTVQQSGNWRVLDTNSNTGALNYAIGTYLLIDTQVFCIKTAPIPLDGWSQELSGPAISSLSAWPKLYNSNIGFIQAFAITTGSSTYFSQQAPSVLSGTWKSRGGGLTQAFVVRVA